MSRKGWVRVDPDELDARQRALNNLRDEFAGTALADRVDRETLNHDGIVSAMHDFVDNWSQKRARISDTMQQAAQFLGAGHAAYQKADDDLAAALRNASTDTAGASGVRVR